MRKTLLILTILGLTTTANAALNISLNGDTGISDIVLSPSDYVTVGIHSDDISDWVSYLDITDDPMLGTIVSSGFTANAGPDSNYQDYSYPPYWEYEITMVDFAGGGTTAGVQFEVTLHCEGPGDIDIYLYDDIFNLLDTATIIIPEPTTIALLGLGGLFLRRNRS